jgi:hypothetical protein
MNPFKYAARLFSNDPSASCSRLLASLCVAYVMIYGSIYFSTLNDIQARYLLGILGGVLPYAFNKISDLRKPPDGMV